MLVEYNLTQVEVPRQRIARNGEGYAEIGGFALVVNHGHTTAVGVGVGTRHNGGRGGGAIIDVACEGDVVALSEGEGVNHIGVIDLVVWTVKRPGCVGQSIATGTTVVATIVVWVIGFIQGLPIPSGCTPTCET